MRGGRGQTRRREGVGRRDGGTGGGKEGDRRRKRGGGRGRPDGRRADQMEEVRIFIIQ